VKGISYRSKNAIFVIFTQDLGYTCSKKVFFFQKVFLMP